MDTLLQFNVNLYEEAPLGVEQLFRQTDMALERLKLYKVLESHEKLTAEELKSKLFSPLTLLLDADPPEEVMKSRKIDFIGHWILRLAYSSTHPSFFTKNELRWFRMRYENMSRKDKLDFIKKNKVQLWKPSQQEVLKFNLGKNWCKVDFRQACALVKEGVYPLSLGYVFIPEEKIGFLLFDRLEKHLKEGLNHARKMLPSACDQLKYILSSLLLIKPFRGFRGKHLDLEDLDKKVRNFPLCMKIQAETLTINHHLKHPSRFQYGLFLKGIGLSLDDSLTMWQNEFTANMTEKKFLKEYSYFFKHLYGTVGGRIDYEPQNCEKILQTPPYAPGVVNGCPFKHWDAKNLSKRLTQDGVSQNEIQEILVLKNENKFKEACTKCFQCLHKCETDEVISHPVMYYEKSCSVNIVDIEDLFQCDSD